MSDKQVLTFSCSTTTLTLPEGAVAVIYLPADEESQEQLVMALNILRSGSDQVQLALRFPLGPNHASMECSIEEWFNKAALPGQNERFSLRRDPQSSIILITRQYAPHPRP